MKLMVVLCRREEDPQFDPSTTESKYSINQTAFFLNGNKTVIAFYS